jgi:DNA polymerase alpha subunit B
MGEIAQNTVKTQLVIVPSAREIEHLSPLPQPAYSQTSFPMTAGVPRPILMSNPSTFKINDITVGVVNTDIFKDMCGSLLTKQCSESKIDLSLKSILQQRVYYPLYPGNPSTPIEWEQFEKMMFPNGVTPDILIVPSQLKLIAKVVEGVVCVNPGYMVKGEAAGSFANITIDPLMLPQGDYEGKGLSHKA